VMPFHALCQTDVSRYGEPTLDELLADPGVRLLMAKDGVDETIVRQIASKIRERIRRSGSHKPAGAERHSERT
jgi:hypothetical protein